MTRRTKGPQSEQAQKDRLARRRAASIEALADKVVPAVQRVVASCWLQAETELGRSGSLPGPAREREWLRRLTKTLVRRELAVAAEGRRMAGAEHDRNDADTPVTSADASFITGDAAEAARQAIDTTVRRIERAWARTHRPGATTAERLDEMRVIGKRDAQTRGRVIAQSASARALNIGVLTAYRDCGYSQLEWVVHPSRRTCNRCWDMRGRIITIATATSPRGKALGKPPSQSLPPLHIGCRCTVMPTWETPPAPKTQPSDRDTSRSHSGPLPAGELEERVRQAEEAVRRSGTEEIIAVNRRGEEVVRAIGQRDRVNLSPAEAQLIRGATAVHNHPRGTPPSVADAKALYRHHIGEIRVVTTTRTYVLSVADRRAFRAGQIDRNFAQAMQRQRERLLEANAPAQRTLTSAQTVEAANNAWKEIAPKHGLRYDVIEVLPPVGIDGKSSDPRKPLPRSHAMPTQTISEDRSDQCSDCRHWWTAVNPDMGRRCAAFPGGIPDEIWSGQRSHRTPCPGDKGIRYDYARPEDIERANSTYLKRNGRVILDFVSTVSIVCEFCRHFHENNPRRERRCKAFPAGIPLAIWNNEHDHRTPYSEDRGILFEPFDPPAQDGPDG
jgi:hypothetical protein